MTTSAENFNAQIDRILWPVFQHGDFVNRTLNTPQEAKLYQRELSGIQAQLRTLKKEINLYKKQVRMHFDDAKTNASSHPIYGMFAGKKNANHLRAQDRQRLRAQEQAALLPFEAITDRIDRCIQMLDQMKLAVDQAIQSGKI